MSESTPPADDVREALAVLLRAHEHSQTSFAHNLLWHRATADAVLAEFEVRPRGMVTDAEVEVAWRTYEGIEPDEQLMGSGIGVARKKMRAALEAAREVRS